ncbi:DUF6800 family protein [Xenorhabdus szentirmaii]
MGAVVTPCIRRQKIKMLKNKLHACSRMEKNAVFLKILNIAGS